MNATLEPGDKVKIVQQPTAPKEDVHLIGRNGTFVGYSRSQGYAIVFFGQERKIDLFFHPENVQKTA